MFGSKSRHHVAIRGDTCRQWATHYLIFALSANALCIFMLFTDSSQVYRFVPATRVRAFEPCGLHR